jgi:hypothetical protein
MEPSLRTTTLANPGLTALLFTFAATGVLGAGYFLVKNYLRKPKKLLSPLAPAQARRRAEERRLFIIAHSNQLWLEVIEAPPGFKV